MKRFLVLGAGKMGITLAKDLVDSSPKFEVTLVDIDRKRLDEAVDFIKNERLKPRCADFEDKAQRSKLFKDKDVVLHALLHRHSLLCLKEAFLHRVHFVDLVGENPLARLKYHKEAKEKDILLLSGLGVSPGLTNICVGRAAYLLDEVDKALIYVGGNPIHPLPPLNYRIVYSIESLLNFYERKAQVILEGKRKKILPLSGIEEISFPPRFPQMECFYTDGLNSLIYTMRRKIKQELWQKTIRHKGHALGIKVLKECGLFSENPIKVDDKEIIPRKFLESLLDSKMALGKGKDITLFRVIVSGRKSGKEETHLFEMIDIYDTRRKLTSMAKVTGYPASIASQMIVTEKIRERGSLFPEEIFHSENYEPFMEELKKRGVLIVHKVSH